MPPCRLILPECEVDVTTVTATYTVTAQVYNGPSSTSETTVTTTITVTASEVSHDPVYVGPGRIGGEVFDPISVIPVPPVTINITHIGGQVTPRIIPIPPYPRTGPWPLPDGDQPSFSDPWYPYRPPPATVFGPGGSATSSSTTQAPNTGGSGSQTSITRKPLTAWPFDDPPYPPGSTDPSYTWTWTGSNPPPPNSPSPPWTTSNSTSAVIWPPWPPAQPSPTGTSSSPTTAILPFRTWPPKSIKPKENKDNDDDWPCDAWFFFVCRTNLPSSSSYS